VKPITPHFVNLEQVSACLPQTQCGLCNHDDCNAYALAIVQQKDTVNHCIPGGMPVLSALGDLTGQDISSFIAPMQKAQTPQTLAIIVEKDCVGCMKCINACPVDAIFGGAKRMHSILEKECNGCERCIAPCPVDCIEMVAVKPEKTTTLDSIVKNAKHYKKRYEIKKQRQQQQRAKQQKRRILGKQADNLPARQQFIQDAIARAQAKRNQRAN
jgi:Na+-translocating ferredoxin:NAD+ oxidoreductase subunit B